MSKVAAEHKTYEEAKAGIDETLKKMGLDYLDMMIIHSPQPWVEVNQSENRYVEGNRAAWKALEDAYKEGKLKAIGVSNFQMEDLKSLMETAEIKPMVNQVLCHISNTPLELIEFCQKNDIAIEAYSPIAHGEILNQPEINASADKYGVTVPQLCIRYTLQLGTISLPKTANPEHMETRSFYHGLVKHGVRVCEWTLGFCHAKMSIVDDCMATCGTINLDYRSLYHHFENGCFMADCQAVVEIKNDLIRTMGECRDVTDQYCTGRSAYLRLGQLFMRLFAGLL